jgi:hypothetical protein
VSPHGQCSLPLDEAILMNGSRAPANRLIAREMLYGCNGTYMQAIPVPVGDYENYPPYESLPSGSSAEELAWPEMPEGYYKRLLTLMHDLETREVSSISAVLDRVFPSHSRTPFRAKKIARIVQKERKDYAGTAATATAVKDLFAARLLVKSKAELAPAVGKLRAELPHSMHVQPAEKQLVIQGYAFTMWYITFCSHIELQICTYEGQSVMNKYHKEYEKVRAQQESDTAQAQA